MTTPAALAVAHVSYAYGAKPALRDVSFTVPNGQCTILLGPNGAGKSTLFALITHLYEARVGCIQIEGHDVKRHSRRALAQLGVVFQQPTLDLDLSVQQNLMYHAALHGLDRHTARSRIQRELERLDMFERRRETVRQLNGGHRRRVEIARALLHEPRVLLLDEPTVGLDVPSRKTIVEYVHGLATHHGLAVFWATHLIDEVYPLDRVVVLHHGQVRVDGMVSEVLNAAGADDLGHAFTRLTTGERRMDGAVHQTA